ncbi:hypothetical protein P22_0325 [Propionispora sp. 2/2-37]|uniref:spore coat protein n=1 Tax=Propionispora sp. 2/2-37 TaxID=1677858 RepID=UPI0006BB5E62|nr:spore coat protein [Propionispora sp. 2/2-37]CUH94259.1 hypothetical protein P22_0325 [Propionispora sp. 2/2-37]
MARIRRNYSQFKDNVSGTGLSDRDMLMDMLLTEKQVSHVYEQATMEASSSELLNMFEAFQQDEHTNAHAIFETLQEKGWYETVGSGATRNSRRFNGRNFITASPVNSNYAVKSSARNFGNKLANNSLASLEY